MEKYVIIFRVDMSSYVGKDILISGQGLTQELDDTALTAEAIYPINLTQTNKKFL